MPSVTVLVPAHNEAEGILDTLRALTAQTRIPDQIIALPNGCSDSTAELARSVPGVTVLELPRLEFKKSEALNIGWRTFAKNADIVVCLDADTVLPSNAIADWEKEFISSEGINPQPKPSFADIAKAMIRQRSVKPLADDIKTSIHTQPLGGSSSKFTMPGGDFLTRLQRAEFSKWTDTALANQQTTVLAGTGCAISGKALREVVERTGRIGPWSYGSQVEDFELTYQIRKLGYRCQVSPTVRAYTDSMKTVRSLWGQRMKWQVGTVEDLLSLGINRLTWFDWKQQFMGIFMSVTRIVWVALLIGLMLTNSLHFNVVWWVAVPLLFASLEIYPGLRIPHRDRTDIIYSIAIIPSEVFAWLRSGWFMAAWIEVLVSRVTGKRKDRWQMQYAAEAKEKE